MASELETLMQISDFQFRGFLLSLLDYKKQIGEKLKEENLSVDLEIKYKDALEMIQEYINKARFSGIL